MQQQVVPFHNVLKSLAGMILAISIVTVIIKHVQEIPMKARIRGKTNRSIFFENDNFIKERMAYSRKKHWHKVLLGVVILCFVQLVHAVPISGLYNTGVNDSGIGLPIGAKDTHYKLEGPDFPLGDANVVAPYFPSSAWTAPFNSTQAQWISSTGTNDAGGPQGDQSYDYKFTTSFDLTGLDPTTAKIDLTFASDNQSFFYINGVQQNPSLMGDFHSLTDISLTSGFIDGINELRIIVDNGAASAFGNPMGLLITSIAGDAEVKNSTVPEPGTLMLFGIGLAGLSLRKK